MPPLSTAAILDAALDIAAGGDRHWEDVRLADVASRLGVTLAEIHRYVRDKEALVDALWERADAALLERGHTLDPAVLAVPDRLEMLVFAWLEPLAAHRRTVREMLLVRLEPGHLHVQLPTLLRVSCTVQWLREAAGLRATFAWRALEESALSALFVTTVALWLGNDDDTRARHVLKTGLKAAHNMRRRIGPRE